MNIPRCKITSSERFIRNNYELTDLPDSNQNPACLNKSSIFHFQRYRFDMVEIRVQVMGTLRFLTYTSRMHAEKWRIVFVSQVRKWWLPFLNFNSDASTLVSRMSLLLNLYPPNSPAVHTTLNSHPSNSPAVHTQQCQGGRRSTRSTLRLQTVERAKQYSFIDEMSSF